MPPGDCAVGDLAVAIGAAADRIEAAWLLAADASAGALLAEAAEIAGRYRRYMSDTVTKTMAPATGGGATDGGVFVITGDIPAMWLRDSSAQAWPLIPLADSSRQARDLLLGITRTQLRLIAADPYANAFNDGPTGATYHPGDLDPDPNIWERKFELDSLAFPIDLIYRLWRAGHVDEEFLASALLREAVAAIVATAGREQHHDGPGYRPGYRFVRTGMPETETLPRDGYGVPVARTGMVWQGFRPSDDRCELGYNVPGNLFLARALGQLHEMMGLPEGAPPEPGTEPSLRAQILAGVAAHGIVTTGGVAHYTYETDGYGQALFMDDANMPSLLSLPLLADVASEDPLYLATRARVLSAANPHYIRGPAAAGVGSPHSPPGYVWPIALAVQGLTSVSAAEQRSLVRTLLATDGGTGWMHEGFDAADPTAFTRAWFSWANMMFCELVATTCGGEPA